MALYKTARNLFSYLHLIFFQKNATLLKVKTNLSGGRAWNHSIVLSMILLPILSKRFLQLPCVVLGKRFSAHMGRQMITAKICLMHKDMISVPILGGLWPKLIFKISCHGMRECLLP